MQSTLFLNLDILTSIVSSFITGGKILVDHSGIQLMFHSSYCIEQCMSIKDATQ